MSMLKTFKNASMESDESIAQQELQSTLKLSIAPENSGIKTVLLPVIQIMLEKFKDLLQEKGLAVPKPGATDGSYIVAGSANDTYSVTPGNVTL